MPAEGALRDRRGADFHLIETMRWEPGAGVVRGDRHLARLARSADALGFAFDRAAAERQLTAVNHDEALRLRLTLQPDGRIGLETFPFEPLPEGGVWTVAVARTRLRSGDPLLVHKTSRRKTYETARAEFSRQEADEVLLVNERGEICEGTITSIFMRRADGPLLTPPLACGLLAGVLREELIAEGGSREAVLTPADLAHATEIYVGNSLRGLIRARLLPGVDA